MSRTLGQYTILDEIGRGGMAVVYRAVQESLGRTVALKELDLGRFRSEPKILERFRLEARSAAALEHPNIITIYDLWEDGNKAFIAMEYVDGVELKTVLAERGPLDFVSAVQISIDVCRALHYAHGRGMIHRDVKPGNIMLSRKGQVRLMDFGIVSVSGTGDLTITGQMLGTPAYMSPEQIASEGLGPGSDMFGFGSVLYEMLTGHRPFQGDNQLALIQRILHNDPAPPTMIVPEIPASLSEAVVKCLAKDPGSRFASMDELADALAETLPAEVPLPHDSVSRLVAPLDGPGLMDPGDETAGVEETTVFRPTPGLGSKDDVPSITEPGDGMLEGAYPGSTGSGDAHPLEMDPPADLPPLETGEAGESTESGKAPAARETEIPLSLKELPPVEENETVIGAAKTRKGGKGRFLLWLLPIVLLVAAGIWKFTGGSSLVPLPGTPDKPAGPAFLTVVADPVGTVSVDGKPLGEVNPSGTFEIPAGLHKVEVANPDQGVKTFIVEVEAGERKKIEVKR